MKQYRTISLPFEVGKEYPLARDSSIKFTVTKIVMCSNVELGVSFFMGNYAGDNYDCMLHGNGLIPESRQMLDFPQTEDWYICQLSGLRQPMKWIAEAKVWSDIDGDCFDPESAAIKWLDDKSL